MSWAVAVDLVRKVEGSASSLGDGEVALLRRFEVPLHIGELGMSFEFCS